MELAAKYRVLFCGGRVALIVNDILGFFDMSES